MFKKAKTTNAENPVLRCSFRNKTQEHVRQLIAGPSVFICGECVKVCNEIIADDARFSRTRDGIAAVAEVKDGAEGLTNYGKYPSADLRYGVHCAVSRRPLRTES